MTDESGARAVRLSVRAKPRAKTSRIVQADGGDRICVVVALAAQPVDGQANDALVRVLADALELPRARITLARGASAKQKLVDVYGLTEKEVVARLLAAASSTPVTTRAGCAS